MGKVEKRKRTRKSPSCLIKPPERLSKKRTIQGVLKKGVEMTENERIKAEMDAIMKAVAPKAEKKAEKKPAKKTEKK